MSLSGGRVEGPPGRRAERQACDVERWWLSAHAGRCIRAGRSTKGADGECRGERRALSPPIAEPSAKSAEPSGRLATLALADAWGWALAAVCPWRAVHPGWTVDEGRGRAGGDQREIGSWRPDGRALAAGRPLAGVGEPPGEEPAGAEG